ncbi:MAG TPA: DUF1499 domain-containing protein [Usitatibacter sp.]|nr:DUF1499 domain-containing protein [Usitatibacter sp.]
MPAAPFPQLDAADSPSPEPWRIVRALALAASLAAFAMLAVSGPGTRLGVWTWQAGLSLMQWGAWTGIAAGAASLVLLATAIAPRWRGRWWVALLALGFSAAAAAPPLFFLAEAKRVPPIHDITTDPGDPPRFVALLGTRLASPNGAAYGGPAVAARQRAAYPDIKPLDLPAPPAQTMRRALEVARAMGWDIVASDPAEGRIEATARTTWFGFRDDVVVRIRPRDGGSRVDVRSDSRVGVSDIGANAARVREFLARLA